ncbi:MAG TPA: MmcQ/YjbR family DNA-binding protein [Myxococcota bacterium]|jgi:hypothetical protein|nr:MmcQ/YjbR family DNA-binding protein [Myxococcota bacterium]
MTENEFRRLALRLPGTTESAHMGHPDFRVAGKIFATLRAPAAGWAMVKLTPDDQQIYVHSEPDAFVPVKGAWGRRGCTSVRLSAAKTAGVRGALQRAWRHTAPRRLAAQHPEE